MLSLVPGYMVVSWTLRLPAVGVRVTCGVEGRPVEGGEMRRQDELVITNVRYVHDAICKSPHQGEV